MTPARWAFHGLVGYSGFTVGFPYPGTPADSIAFADADCSWTWIFHLSGDDGNNYGLEWIQRPNTLIPGIHTQATMTDHFGSIIVVVQDYDPNIFRQWGSNPITQYDSTAFVLGAFEDRFAFNRRPWLYSEEP
jgi:hypothetical protein